MSNSISTNMDPAMQSLLALEQFLGVRQSSQTSPGTTPVAVIHPTTLHSFIPSPSSLSSHTVSSQQVLTLNKHPVSSSSISSGEASNIPSGPPYEPSIHAQSEMVALFNSGFGTDIGSTQAASSLAIPSVSVLDPSSSLSGTHSATFPSSLPPLSSSAPTPPLVPLQSFQSTLSASVLPFPIPTAIPSFPSAPPLPLVSLTLPKISRPIPYSQDASSFKNRKMAVLEERIQDRQREIWKLSSQAAALNSRYTILEQAKIEKKAAIALLRAIPIQDKQSQQFRIIEEEINSLSNNIVGIKKDQQTIASNFEGLYKELSIASNFAGLYKEFSITEKEFIQTRETYQQYFQSMQQEAVGKQQENQDLTLASYLAAAKTASAERESLEGQIQKLDQDLATLKTKITTTNTKKTRLKRRKNAKKEIQKEINTLTTEIQDLRKQRQTLIEDIKFLNWQKLKKQKEEQDLMRQYYILKKSNPEPQALQNGHKRKVAQLEEPSKRLQVVKDFPTSPLPVQEKEDLDKIEETLKGIEKELEMAIRELEKIETQLKDKKNKLKINALKKKKQELTLKKQQLEIDKSVKEKERTQLRERRENVERIRSMEFGESLLSENIADSF